MKIIKNNNYCYALQTFFGREVGCIDAVYDGKSITIDRFCVALKYRGTKKQYGKLLLNYVINDAKQSGVSCIFVTPKAEEIYDDIEQMELIDLYRKYLNLGFEFCDNDALKAYDNKMKLVI